jgi:GDP-4-dehydro-6-deoxy-D-mannose reductase
MKALVTGAGGFIGSHMVDSCLARGLEVVATVYNRTSNLNHVKDRAKIVRLDVSDRKAVEALITKEKPDYIFHYAAQSFVMPSWEDPARTMESNIMGTLNILESLRKNEMAPKAILACSSAAYGLTSPGEIPISESREFRPSSPYGVSKAATDHLGFAYWRAQNMSVVRLRIFNTIGPRKTGSAIADWAQQIAEIEAGKRDKLHHGNLGTTVDFTDVKDHISAVWTLAEKGKPGEAYNVCSGTGRKMADVLKALTSLSKVPIKTFEDPSRFRPADDPIFIGDNSKLKALGWKPRIPFEQTLRDTLDWCRANC